MGEERRRVVLYGNSVFMAGLEESLKKLPALDVKRAEISLADASQDLERFRPNAVVFELTSSGVLNVSLQSLVALLRDGLHLLLIGVDPTTATAIVFSGRQQAILSAEELGELLFA